MSKSPPESKDRFGLMVLLVGVAIIASGFGVLWWMAGGGSIRRSPTRVAESATRPLAESTDADGQPVQFEADVAVPEGLFNYGGSTSWVPVHEQVEPAIAAQFPDYQLRYTLPAGRAPGSGSGIDMLINGQLTFAESSRPVTPEEYEAAQRRGFDLIQVPTAIDGIALAVHPDLNASGIDGLNVEQVRAIYTGQVTNWRDLGGPDLPIQALSRSAETSGTAKFFLESVVDADDYDDSVRMMETTTEAIRVVAETPGAIYYASSPEVVPQCSIYPLPIAPADTDAYVAPYQAPLVTNCPEQRNSINREGFRSGDYPLTRRLFVVIKADGDRDEAAGRAYSELLLSPTGQTLIESSGFVGIR
ncbi:MAG: substrate-binding domain-containing protein [Cyanobacteria bacterium P01_A01_bin.105]